MYLVNCMMSKQMQLYSDIRPVCFICNWSERDCFSFDTVVCIYIFVYVLFVCNIIVLFAMPADLYSTCVNFTELRHTAVCTVAAS